jgi:hypothetical protein
VKATETTAKYSVDAWPSHQGRAVFFSPQLEAIIEDFSKQHASEADLAHSRIEGMGLFPSWCCRFGLNLVAHVCGRFFYPQSRVHIYATRLLLQISRSIAVTNYRTARNALNKYICSGKINRQMYHKWTYLQMNVQETGVKFVFC